MRNMRTDWGPMGMTTKYAITTRYAVVAGARSLATSLCMLPKIEADDRACSAFLRATRRGEKLSCTVNEQEVTSTMACVYVMR